MSFVPDVVSPEYSEVKTRTTYEGLSELKFPEDAAKIKRLTLAAKQVWYAGQDPQILVQSDADFHQFWYLNYIFPLKLKRFAYIFKFW